MNKTCTQCHTEHPEEFFAFKSKAENKRIAQCKNCIRAYNRAHYKKNPATYKICAKRNNRKRYAERARWLLDYLKDKYCKDCGEKDPIVLTFDHVDRDQKTESISKLMLNLVSINNLLQEIAKCEIRCANCHMRRTAHQMGWLKAGH